MDFKNNIVLENPRVQLRPFAVADLAGLNAQALDEEIWRYTVNCIATEADLARWGQEVLEARANGTRYTFVVLDKARNQLIGSTSYGNISGKDKRLEIGWTWLGKNTWGSDLNRHCKFLLLRYAFEVLQYERVELKTDVLNLRSRKAMLKLGATEEGILRSHTLMHDGRRRDTIYYSFLRPEWPGVKAAFFPDVEAL